MRILFRILFGRRYTATATRKAWKECCCECCQNEYLYEIVCTATGREWSLLWLENKWAQQEAERLAQEEVKRKVFKAIGAVACPRCGWFQQAMVSMRRHNLRKLVLWLSLPIAVMLAVFWSNRKVSGLDAPWQLPAAVAIGSIGTIGAMVAPLLINPNRGHAGQGFTRHDRALASLGVLKENFEEHQRQREALEVNGTDGRGSGDTSFSGPMPI